MTEPSQSLPAAEVFLLDGLFLAGVIGLFPGLFGLFHIFDCMVDHKLKFIHIVAPVIRIVLHRLSAPLH